MTSDHTGDVLYLEFLDGLMNIEFGGVVSINVKFRYIVSERKLTKTVISSKARNLIVLKIQALKISPYGRNDKKRG
ncbi:MAG: hypothetical protein DRP37_07125, partial [Thermodesulfobacteriota bacterium]